MNAITSVRDRSIPAIYRQNFNHLIWDIAWFGVLNGSAIAFSAIFAVRQGATGFQIGLLNAGPAIVNIAFALPAGLWLKRRAIDRSVFFTAVSQRFFYLLFVFFPWLVSPRLQVWGLILFTLVMSIPGSALAVGFNALFAGAVPNEWRGIVASRRNAAFALTSIGVSLFSGWLLNRLPFPVGYQVVFGIGFLGAVMSTVHLWFVHPHDETAVPSQSRVRHLAQPGSLRSGEGLHSSSGLRFLVRVQSLLQTIPPLKFRLLVLFFFIFHFTQYLGIPLFPLFWVNVLDLSDQTISLGNGLFYIALFVGSTQIGRLSSQWGYKKAMVIGIMMMSLYPALTAATQTVPFFLFTSIVGGLAWSLVSGALGNYLLDEIPTDQRPGYLAWYNIALNAGILFGSLLGPLMADGWGLVMALLITAVGRLLSSFIFWRY